MIVDRQAFRPTLKRLEPKAKDEALGVVKGRPIYPWEILGGVRRPGERC
jgi:hypothetical protein